MSLSFKYTSIPPTQIASQSKETQKTNRDGNIINILATYYIYIHILLIYSIRYRKPKHNPRLPK